MEKLIANGSYWLGMACLVIGALWKAANAFGLWVPSSNASAYTIGHSTFVHASIAFFVATIATASYAWLNSTKP
jgi:hypothetical protein